ncbi:MAG: PEP-CTERM sorting domain-containing protein [Phycisphaerales bacterium]|jgi:hypothetical protein|nr:PEP-CTERM sorting domain-containing protein [Phycisphaerales bacterium]MBT7170982.1 PEP-CTERM sorting domain-containing protein [Phycisphaerales bacterium]
MQMNLRLAIVSIVVALLACTAGAAGIFDISLDYGSTSQADIDTYGTAFNNAAATWENYISGYQPGININADGNSPIVITVNLDYIDGAGDAEGNILGSAGPTRGYVNYNDTGYTFTTEGSMTFDTYDLDMMVAQPNNYFENVILHEMGHVLGIGTLWGPAYNDVYIEGSGEYTGASALAAYQAEFDPEATFVPVELDGGSGTANSHWNEVGDEDALTSQFNLESMNDELMTGWASGDMYVSNVTLGSLEDIGYSVNYNEHAPEPATMGLLALGGMAMLKRRKRRRA